MFGKGVVDMKRVGWDSMRAWPASTSSNSPRVPAPMRAATGEDARQILRDVQTKGDAELDAMRLSAIGFDVPPGLTATSLDGFHHSTAAQRADLLAHDFVAALNSDDPAALDQALGRGFQSHAVKHP